MHDGLHIFLADDDEDDRAFLLTAFAKRRSLQHSIFPDGDQLVNYFLKERIPLIPDAILLDINMPAKNGFETLQELKKLSAAKRVPVMFLTSSDNNADKEKCLNLGCDAFYTKPRSLAEYDPIVADILKRIGATSS